MSKGYTPAFKVNTDAKFAFEREFSRGMQNDKEIFGKCLIWAVSPTVKEYNGITTSHFIHPDNWAPYAPLLSSELKSPFGSMALTAIPLSMIQASSPHLILTSFVTNRLLLTKCFKHDLIKENRK